jgi:hypothetical protein
MPQNIGLLPLITRAKGTPDDCFDYTHSGAVMHLVVMIALGVFGGLWIFTRWANWSADRPYRREMKRLNREIRQQARERSTAEHDAKLAREAAVRSGTPSLSMELR